MRKSVHFRYVSNYYFTFVYTEPALFSAAKLYKFTSTGLSFRTPSFPGLSFIFGFIGLFSFNVGFRLLLRYRVYKKPPITDAIKTKLTTMIGTPSDCEFPSFFNVVVTISEVFVSSFSNIEVVDSGVFVLSTKQSVNIKNNHIFTLNFLQKI